jgi:hypothetical protein
VPAALRWWLPAAPVRRDRRRSWLVPAVEDGGDVLRGHAVQVQVDLWRPFDRAPRFCERLGSPAGHMAVFCNTAPGCRSVWYRRHERP